ncbi:hypothetical protein Bbelb_010160 [Branchiostoma belcheri]|nr:hypothetical protein Bbelb_010160 [Branchiostoma belcheri]
MSSYIRDTPPENYLELETFSRPHITHESVTTQHIVMSNLCTVSPVAVVGGAVSEPCTVYYAVLLISLTRGVVVPDHFWSAALRACGAAYPRSLASSEERKSRPSQTPDLPPHAVQDKLLPSLNRLVHTHRGGRSAKPNRKNRVQNVVCISHSPSNITSMRVPVRDSCPECGAPPLRRNPQGGPPVRTAVSLSPFPMTMAASGLSYWSSAPGIAPPDMGRKAFLGVLNKNCDPGMLNKQYK